MLNLMYTVGKFCERFFLFALMDGRGPNKVVPTLLSFLPVRLFRYVDVNYKVRSILSAFKPCMTKEFVGEATSRAGFIFSLHEPRERNEKTKEF